MVLRQVMREAPRRLRIWLVAEEAAGLKTYQMLRQAGHQVLAVHTSSPDGTHRGACLWDRARRDEVPLRSAFEVREPELAAAILDAEADLLLNVHSLHRVDDRVLAAPRIGCFNLHPGPLPRFAGLNAPMWAVWRGVRQYGVTLHWMESGIDTGDIAYQALFPVPERPTGLSLSAQCVRSGLPLCAQLLDAAARDPASIPRLAQDLERREYFGRSILANGWIDWERPVAEVDRLIRAFQFHPLPSPWGAPRTRLDGDEVGILVAAPLRDALALRPPGSIGPRQGDAVPVACLDGWLAVSWVAACAGVWPAADWLTAGRQCTSAAAPQRL